MTRAQLMRKATSLVLANEIKEFHRGLCDEDWLKEMAKRRQPTIAATFAELVRDEMRPPSRCADCGMPGTTIMGGRAYCDTHASAHKRENPK